MDKLHEEYEKGRKEVKEYPLFGLKTLPSSKPKRRRSNYTLHAKLKRSDRWVKKPRTAQKRRAKRDKKGVHDRLDGQQWRVHLNGIPPGELEDIENRLKFIKDSQKMATGLKREAQPVNILVNYEPEKTMCFTVEDTCSVRNLKQKIETRLGMPHFAQNLRHQGRPVKNNEIVANICKQRSDLHLLLFAGQLRGGAPPPEADKESQGRGCTERDENADGILETAKKFGISPDKLAEFIKQQRGQSSSTVEDQTSTSPQDGQSLNYEHDETESVLPFLRKSFPGISFSTGTPSPESKEMVFIHLFGRKGGKANYLEENVSFFFLFNPEETTLTDDNKKILWSDVVQSNTKHWTNNLSNDQKINLDISKEEDIVYLKGEPLEFRFGIANKSNEETVKALPFDTRTISSEGLTVLLVEESVVKSNIKGHFCTSKGDKIEINFDRTREKPYHAMVAFKSGGVTCEWGDLMIPENSIEEIPNFQNRIKCQPRQFKSRPDEQFMYREGGTLDCEESGDAGSLLKPCHEFKLLTKAVKTNTHIQKFCYEVIRFACACLNSRKNGTIHFGIADEKGEQAVKCQHTSCEIIGVRVLDESKHKGDLLETDKTEYKDKLTEAINNSFDLDIRDFARNCIGSPTFVKVEVASACANDRYVIEVDIEPSYLYTQGKLFCVTLPDLGKKQSSKVSQYFLRDGAQSSSRTFDSLMRNVPKFDQRRKQEELLGKKSQNMTRQLQSMIGEDCGKLDNDFKRILVLSSTDKRRLTKEFLDNAKVISNIPWSYIIDFNQADKDEPGLCQTITDISSFEIHDAPEFCNERMRECITRKAWVFGNGIGETSSSLPWEKWQLSKRASGLEELVKTTSDKFPQNRTLIMFIIREGFSKIEALTFGMFIRHFGENAVSFYIENDENEIEWMNYITNDLKYFDEHKFLCRGIFGISWKEFTVVIGNLTSDCPKGMIYIPLTNNTLCKIERGFFNDESVKIMDSEECDYLCELSTENPERYDQEKQNKQQEFYSGQEVSMENLWFTGNGANQVLKRDAIDKLDEALEYILAFDPYTCPRIEKIRLLYSRGSGGTTAARHFLWNLYHHKPPFKCRCCMVNSITPKTASTLYNLWEYSLDHHLNTLPGVVLVDDQEDKDFEDLVKGLSEKLEGSRSQVSGVAMILLRVEPNSHPEEEARKGSKRQCVSMDYMLSEKEHRLFQGKYQDMQRSYGHGFREFADKTLPSFIMMTQRSRDKREDYAKSRVESALPDLNGTERSMLMFLSLIHFSVPNDRFTDVTALDPIMASPSYIEEGHSVSWNKNLSLNAKIFLRFKGKKCSDPESDQITLVSITFNEFAEAILMWAENSCGKTLGDIALDLMKSAAFPSSFEVSRSQECVKILHDKMYYALVRKKMVKGGKREMFSKLIINIVKPETIITKDNLDRAIDVMSTGFEKLHSPVLAQQVARLAYIHGSSMEGQSEYYFQLAEAWIPKALSIEGNNSFFLDTAGRIQLRRLKEQFLVKRSSKYRKKLDTDDEILRAVKLGLESIKWFQASQKAEQMSMSLNTAGYCGEMQAMTNLLSVLSNSKVFDYRIRNVQRYVCMPKWKLRHVPWPAENEEKLKMFRKRYMLCFRKVEEIDAILKVDEDIDAHELYSDFREFFICLDEGHEADKHLAKWKQNEMVIQRHIGGSIFKNVFNFHRVKYRTLRCLENRENLLDICERLEQNVSLPINDDLKVDDIFVFIAVKMALHSPFRWQGFLRNSPMKEFLYAKRNVEALLRKENATSKPFVNYCLLLDFMFQWPGEKGNKVEDNWADKYHEKLKRLVKMSTTIQKKYQKPEINVSEEFNPRKKNKPSSTYTPVTTLFYLGNGEGLMTYVHINELRTETTEQGLWIDWEHPYIAERLLCLEGKRISQSTIEWTTTDKKVLRIEVSGECRNRYSLQKVLFYVGFSWKGPLACGVRKLENR